MARHPKSKGFLRNCHLSQLQSCCTRSCPRAGRPCWTSPPVEAGHRVGGSAEMLPLRQHCLALGKGAARLALSWTPAGGWGSWLAGVWDSCFLPSSAPESYFSSSHVKWVCRSSYAIFVTFAQTRGWEEGCEGGKFISFHHPCIPKKCFWPPIFDF